MTLHLPQLTFPPPPPELVAEVALDECLDEETERVSGRPHTHEDQGDGKDLLAGIEPVDLTEAYGGHGDDGLEDGIDQPVAEGQVAHGAPDQHCQKTDKARAQPPRSQSRPLPSAPPGRHGEGHGPIVTPRRGSAGDGSSPVRGWISGQGCHGRQRRNNLRPRQDSNLRTRLRRPMLYPLSYEGV